MFVSIFFLYFFIGFKIRHLINSYYKYAIIEVKDMEDEPLRGLLEDKNESGNFYQCYYNLINMLREFIFCMLLYFLVGSPKIVITLISAIQFINLLAMSFNPPYKKSWMNVNLIITNFLYLLLDVVLACLIYGGDRISKEVKYNIFGFGMIGIVFGLLVCNLGISLYFSIVEFIRKRRLAKLQKIKMQERNQKSKLQGNQTTPVSPSKLLSKVDQTNNCDVVFQDPVSPKLLNQSTANGSALLNQSGTPLLDSVTDSPNKGGTGSQNLTDSPIGSKPVSASISSIASIKLNSKMKSKVLNRTKVPVEIIPDSGASLKHLDSVFSKQKKDLKVADFLKPNQAAPLLTQKNSPSGNGSIENINFDDALKVPNNPNLLTRVQEASIPHKLINVEKESLSISPEIMQTRLSISSRILTSTQSPSSPNKSSKKPRIIKQKIGGLTPLQQATKPLEELTSHKNQQQ